jgi:hypothetical protein
MEPESDRDRLAAELAELHSWRGLMSLLDEHWPADVFDGSSDDSDPGPRIVFLVRQVDLLRRELVTVRERDAMSASPDTGADRIRFERCRQVLLKGFSLDHDDQHSAGELVAAAVAYANAGLVSQYRPDAGGILSHMDNTIGWPWQRSEWKPSDDPIENLVRAGALIAAEIDRLLRLREEK